MTQEQLPQVVEFLGKLPPQPAPAEWMPPASIRPMAGPVMKVVEFDAADHVKFGNDLFDERTIELGGISFHNFKAGLRKQHHPLHSFENLALNVYVARERAINRGIPEAERQASFVRNATLAYQEAFRNGYPGLKERVKDRMIQLLGKDATGQVTEEIRIHAMYEVE